MTQDALGFMWFGTQDGLNRYDGYGFKVFRAEPGNPATPSANIILALTTAGCTATTAPASSGTTTRRTGGWPTSTRAPSK